MKAIVCREFGLPDTLNLEEVPDPTPGSGELLIEVRAAGVGFPDALLVQDQYQYKATLPFTPGGEVAGVVLGLGEGVTEFSVGDRVCGGVRDGGFAERAVMRAETARPIPAALDFGQATGLLYAYGTTLYALRDRGDLSGEWKLYRELPQGLQGSAFQLAGQGAVESDLGLDDDAAQRARLR